MIERVHSRKQYMEEKKRFRKCKRRSSRVWKETEYKRRQEKLKMVEKRDFRKGELLKKYLAKILCK